MKRWAYTLVFTSLLVGQKDPTAHQIIKKMTTLLNPERSRALMTQTIETSSGKTRTMEFEMFTADSGSSVFMRYSKPTSVRGQSFLMLNDAEDIWTYFPRTRRVRKLASSSKNQKVQGSDFNFGDFSSNDMWRTDYTTAIGGDTILNGDKCWKIRADETATNDTDYPIIILFVRQSDYSPLLMYYFNREGRHEKTMTFENIENIDGIPTATTMSMQNDLEYSETVMKVIEMDYNWKPEKDFFSERNLKK